MLPLGSVPRNLKGESHADTDVGALLRPLALQFHGEPAREFIEFERLLKVRNGAKVRALVLIFRLRLSRDNKDRNRRRVTRGAKALA
jgi:hypothetical protein